MSIAIFPVVAIFLVIPHKCRSVWGRGAWRHSDGSGGDKDGADASQQDIGAVLLEDLPGQGPLCE